MTPAITRKRDKLCTVRTIQTCKKVLGIRILGIVNVNVEISDDKKFARNDSSLRDSSLKISRKLTDRNSFG
jgi:hypothetical protein